MTSLDSLRPCSFYARRREKLAQRWSELCTHYLPIASETSFWRHSRSAHPGDPEQGWKLHISATILTAPRVLGKIAPVLNQECVQFKAPASLDDIGRLNSGIDNSFSQVGKIITVYPTTDQEAVAIARQLHRLTRHLPAPTIPFDLRYSAGSNVYYRYGAFRNLKMVLPDGRTIPAIRDPEGNMVPDHYGLEWAQPVWTTNPFPKHRRKRTEFAESPLRTRFRAIRALSQRGKGGVYQAIDLSAKPPGLCLLKEGRRVGEVEWNGSDGSSRIKREHKVLSILGAAQAPVPRIYASFEVAGNYYLVTEFVDGESLHSVLMKRKRRFSIAKVLKCGIHLSNLIARLHDAGWTWRDCKPANLMLTRQGALRPLDFEGACQIDDPEPLYWATPGFTPPRRKFNGIERPAVHVDLFGIGAVLYLLLTGRMPENIPAVDDVRNLRTNAPLELCRLISELLDPDGKQCPPALEISNRLSAVLLSLTNS